MGMQDLIFSMQMLVVGFSLTDENLHMIMGQIHNALHERGRSRKPLGTILNLVEHQFFKKLWDQNFHVASLGISWADDPAWKHDVFLDYFASCLVAKRAASSFVLNPKYMTLLSE